jgi:hypothetical protein
MIQSQPIAASEATKDPARDKTQANRRLNPPIRAPRMAARALFARLFGLFYAFLGLMKKRQSRPSWEQRDGIDCAVNSAGGSAITA